MPGIVWQANVVDLAGNVIPAANVEVRLQDSGVLVPIYADYLLAAPLVNPTITDAFGFIRLFVGATGRYRIKASKGGFTREWQHVLLLAEPATGAFVPTGITTPAALAAGNNNNWDAGIVDTTIGRVRTVGDAAGSTITGMQGGTDGHRVILTNVAANDITILHESALSVAANRFNMNGDLFWPAGVSHEFLYEGFLSRWSKLGN